ncbi:MAG TPA: tRNA 4-thiouridine(8) synthase ThiI [Syntrophales bacterium]|nr:tRNA 4-thiouridine(8) synthase ThiI [Syntrophales bacterium]
MATSPSLPQPGAVRAVALFSGGLDSVLAVQVVRLQGIDVLGVSFETPFFSARKAREAARQIDLSLRVVDFADEHLEMVKAPRYGYGRNMNPCIDCHALMLRKAGGIMEETGAAFILTGEVLGQRPMSQGKQSLYVVAKNSGYLDRVVRPLSALLLPETAPEREGKVDRERLLAIQGRGRKIQMQMAADMGITRYETPAGGCLLTDVSFSRRLRDLFAHNPGCTPRDVEMLKQGRHFRIDERTRAVVGRNHRDNLAIERAAGDRYTLIRMAGYPGPLTALSPGWSEEGLRLAASLCVLYSDAPKDRPVEVNIRAGTATRSLEVAAATPDEAAGRLV